MKLYHVVKCVETDPDYATGMRSMLLNAGFEFIDSRRVYAMPYEETSEAVEMTRSWLDGLHGLVFTAAERSDIEQGIFPAEFGGAGPTGNRTIDDLLGDPVAAKQAWDARHADVIAWLQAYDGSFEFYLSVKEQLRRRGTLSDKQVDAIRRAIDRAKVEAAAKTADRSAPPVASFSLKPGQSIEIKAWCAKKIRDELGLKVVFRNLDVIEVLRETAKAYQVRVKFFAGIAVNCHFCGRDLDNDVSRATGIGPVCAKKNGIVRYSAANAADVLAQLEAMAEETGVVGPLWIAKSQIVQILPTKQEAL